MPGSITTEDLETAAAAAINTGGGGSKCPSTLALLRCMLA